MLVANEEQANLCLRKSRLIELIFIFMTQYLINNQRQHIKLNAQLFKSFARIMSGLMPINHARAQVLMARGRYTNSREFLQTMLILLKSDWPMLDRIEREEIVANGVKSLRILVEDDQAA